MKILRTSLIFIISGLRPILGPAACKFPIGCTEYAVKQLTHEPLFKAFWHIFKRILSCSPFSRSVKNTL